MAKMEKNKNIKYEKNLPIIEGNIDINLFFDLRKN